MRRADRFPGHARISQLSRCCSQPTATTLCVLVTISVSYQYDLAPPSSQQAGWSSTTLIRLSEPPEPAPSRRGMLHCCTLLAAADRDVRAPTWSKFWGDLVARIAIFRTIALGTRDAAPGVRERVKNFRWSRARTRALRPGGGLRQPSPTPGDTCDYHLK